MTDYEERTGKMFEVSWQQLLCENLTVSWMSQAEREAQLSTGAELQLQILKPLSTSRLRKLS